MRLFIIVLIQVLYKKAFHMSTLLHSLLPSPPPPSLPPCSLSKQYKISLIPPITTHPMQSTPIDMSKDLQKIIKQGFLQKQSRYLKSWRKRWFVLTPLTLYSFKQRKVYNSPTEALPLKNITSIKSCEDETQKEFTFKIEAQDRSYYLCATSTVEKEQWIGQIGKAMVKLNVRETEFE